MEKTEKALKISGIVFNCAWIVVSAILWGVGISMFLGEKTFGNWMLWGVFCAIPIIIPVMKIAMGTAKDGRRQGANSYTATDRGNSVVVENHPFAGAVFGFVFGVVLSLLVGPALLIYYFIKTVIKTVRSIIALKQSA